MRGPIEDAQLVKRRAAAARGARAEQVVSAWLTAHGFVVVGNNVRVGRLELDIVARRDEVVVVVEVRTRGSGAWERGFESVRSGKRERVRQAGERLWSRAFANDPSAHRMRFDAASVIFEGGHEWVEYAAGVL